MCTQKVNFILQFLFAGICPSSLEGLQGAQGNLNALLRYAVAGLQAVNGLTKVRALDATRNSLWTSACEMLPTIPTTFYCRAQGQDIRFQANETTFRLSISGGFSGPKTRVSFVDRFSCYNRQYWKQLPFFKYFDPNVLFFLETPLNNKCNTENCFSNGSRTAHGQRRHYHLADHSHPPGRLSALWTRNWCVLT